MKNENPRVLMVGCPAAFGFVLDLIEESDSYIVDCASTLKTARFFLRRSPAVVLLHLPADSGEIERRLAWMETIKAQAPVVILPEHIEPGLYLNALERGAFDFITKISTRVETLRALENALRRRKHTAA